MKYSTVFNEIYKNIMDGKIYATFHTNVRFPYYWTVLERVTGRNGKDLIYWSNYGSSHNPATKKDLQWILTNIFKTTPEQFIATHECITEYEQTHAIYKGVCYEQVDNGYNGPFDNIGAYNV